jgi:carbamoyltransferase
MNNKENKYILGLSTMGSSSASLFKNKKLIAAIEEERITRIKNDGGFPIQSIKECLSIANLSIEDIDTVCVYWQPLKLSTRVMAVLKKIIFSIKFNTSIKYTFYKISSLFFNKKNNLYPEDRGSWLDLFFIKNIIKKNIGAFHGKVFFLNHHLTHQSYAVAIKNWQNSIILSYDGGGESHSTIISVNLNNQLIDLKKIKWPNSLGHFYSFFTGYLGFRMLEGEYKMMGLAPYGKPIYKDIILNQILILKENGDYKFNTNICDYHGALQGQFNSKLINLFGHPRLNNEAPTDDHLNLASSIQAAFEEAQMHMLKWAKELYPEINNLVLSGGCALNVSANGKILNSKLFEKISLPPAPHDAGCSIGAVLAHYYKSENLFNFSNFLNINSPYLGTNFSNHDIVNAFASLNLSAPKKLNDDEIINLTSDALINKNIVAWYNGRDEFGPRALGSRSFLADPRNDNIRDEINKKIKKRELFRPFAPSVIKEECKNYFDIDQESPYMNIVANVIKDKINIIPAVTHTDGTARIHTVSYDDNPMYYKLIRKFGEKTGVPVLLNTSFNIQEPIVRSPTDAIQTFLKSGVDILIIGNYICDHKWKNQKANHD